MITTTHFILLNQLSKTLHQIFRKAALGRVRDNKTEIAITEDNLHQFVGNPKWTRYWVFLERKKDLFVRVFVCFVCLYVIIIMIIIIIAISFPISICCCYCHFFS